MREILLIFIFIILNDSVFRTKSEAISLLPRSHKVHNMIKHFGEKSLKPRVGYENSKRNENLYMRKSQERNIPIYILTRSKPNKRKDTPNYEKLYDEKWNMYVVDPGEYQGHSTEYKADRRFNAKKHKLKAMDIINKQLNKKLIARSNFKPKTSRRHAYASPARLQNNNVNSYELPISNKNQDYLSYENFNNIQIRTAQYKNIPIIMLTRPKSAQNTGGYNMDDLFDEKGMRYITEPKAQQKKGRRTFRSARKPLTRKKLVALVNDELNRQMAPNSTNKLRRNSSVGEYLFNQLVS